MADKLKSKVAVVTGGGSGIGKATAIRFAEEGAKVIIIGRREEKLQEVVAENGNISYVAADLTKTEDVTKVINAVKERFDGHLDILVNNAGCVRCNLSKRLLLQTMIQRSALMYVPWWI